MDKDNKPLVSKKTRFHYFPEEMQPNDVPENYRFIEVFYSPDAHELVIPIIPDQDDEDHNCDYEGCGSCSHVVRIKLGADNPPKNRSDK